ncbi:hypothetical protein GCM10010129_20720 [Streptomyces fumigatiscleroticus]|nr:hypothetical protein GCM10010129_20720 [Streptomyces fumigatiscleroticus]
MPVDTHDDPFEDRLGAALHQAGGSFDADRTALAAGGAARGRRLLLRRRAAVAGGVAGVALAGVGGALLVPWDGGDRGSVGAGPTPAPSVSASASAEPADPVSGDELLRTLKTLLPAGAFSGEASRGTSAKPGPYAKLVYDDGKGAAEISLGLDRVEPGSTHARELAACPDEVHAPYDDCTADHLADGSSLRILKTYEYPDRRADTKLWSADLVTPQGHHVALYEWNAAAEKDAPVSRPNPPLDPAAMRKVVTAEAWRSAIDAIPRPHRPAATTTATAEPPSADGKAINKLLAGLLPDDVDVVGDGGQETEYGYVVVDDGKGASFVQINVQPGMSDVADQLFGSGSETLPDGTRVTERKGAGDNKGLGLVMWTVDTLRTDGLRVVVSAFNSGSQITAPTRDTPALTMAELRTIATSEQWAGLVR